MASRSAILEELRELLKNGATPSRLLRHIIVQHPGEVLTHWALREYLEEAFHLSEVRLLQSDTNYTILDLRYAVLNRTVMPEIVRQRTEWDHSGQSSSRKERCWLDGLVAIYPEQAKVEAQHIP